MQEMSPMPTVPQPQPDVKSLGLFFEWALANQISFSWLHSGQPTKRLCTRIPWTVLCTRISSDQSINELLLSLKRFFLFFDQSGTWGGSYRVSRPPRNRVFERPKSFSRRES